MPLIIIFSLNSREVRAAFGKFDTEPIPDRV